MLKHYLTKQGNLVQKELREGKTTVDKPAKLFVRNAWTRARGKNRRGEIARKKDSQLSPSHGRIRSGGDKGNGNRMRS